MNTKFIQYANIAFWALSLFCYGQPDPAFSTKIKIQISDDSKNPVEGADVLIAYAHLVDGKQDKSYTGKTDAAGIFQADDKVNGSVLVRVSKENYYSLFVEDVVIRTDVDRKKIKNINLPLIIRRVKMPVSLYAKKVSIAIPNLDQPVGFDFEAGDWVKPFGIGIHTDFLISFTNSLTGYEDGYTYETLLSEVKSAHAINPSAKESYFKEINKFYGSDKKYSYEDAIKKVSGKWTGSMLMTFSNINEGISLVDKDYYTYSGLRMPHMAYKNGYEATWKREEKTFTPRNDKEGIGYFLKTRSKLDDQGEIISANYAKFTSDIQFDPRGRVEFTYVFNPTPNDRNLEFNPHANLFKNPSDDERVMSP